MNTSTNDFAIFIHNATISLYSSPIIFILKIVLGIYLAVLLLNIILLLIMRDIPAHVRIGLRGMDIPLITKNKMQKRWDAIKQRLKSEDTAQYKIAVIEADAMADEILTGIGYKGANMTEKLEQVGTAHLDDHLEALKGVHQIRNRIVHEENFEIDQRLATAVIWVYENFLRYLEYLK
jgi:hypothetical protein